MFQKTYRKEQAWQIMHACDLGLRFLFNKELGISLESDWLNFTDAANHMKDFADDWHGWMNEIREAATELLHIKAEEREKRAGEFVELCIRLMYENWAPEEAGK